MSYTRKNFVNGTVPALSAENMNDIEQAIVDNENAIAEEVREREDFAITTRQDIQRIQEMAVRGYEKAQEEIESEKSARESADSQMDARISETEKTTEKHDKDIDYLYKIMNGVVYDEEIVTSASKEVKVPNKALPKAELIMLGGMSRKGKNLLDLNSSVKQTINGVTFEPHFTNGLLDYISINGTASANTFYNINGVDYSADTILSGCAENGGSNSFELTLWASGLSAVVARDYGNGAKINASGTNGVISLTVKSGVSMAHKFYPMIRLASITDATYEPYTESLIDAKVDEVVTKGINYCPIEPYKNETSAKASFVTTENFKLPKGTFTVRFWGKHGEGNANIYSGNTSLAHIGWYSATASFTLNEETLITKIDCDVKANETLYIDIVKGSDAPENHTPHYEKRKTIPTSITSLPDYGVGINENCYNYIDFANKKYHRRVASVDLGSLNWTYMSNSGAPYFTTTSLANLCKPSTMNILSAPYKTVQSGLVSNDDMQVGRNSVSNLHITNRTYSNANDFKSAMSGVWLYYELTTEEIIDIDIDDDFNILEVEGNGTVAFNYPQADIYDVDVPSTIDYAIHLV